MGHCACTPFSTNANDDCKRQAVQPNAPNTPNTPKELDPQQFETEVITNILNNLSQNALDLCETEGIPIIVSIDSMRHAPSALNIDKQTDESKFYIRVQIDELQKFTKVPQPKTNPTWNENILFILPFDSIDDIITNGKLNITFKLYEHSNESIARNVSYMSNNTELLMDIDDRKVSYDPSTNEVTMTATKVYEKSVYDQLAGVDAVVQSPIAGFNFLQTSLANESISYMKSPTMATNDSGIVKIDPIQLERSATNLAAAKTYNVCSDDENCVGKYILEIDLKCDTSVYYKQVQKGKLVYNEDNKLLDVGQISYQIYLNLVQIYQQ